jgi:4-coumarate--CoA ligase
VRGFQASPTEIEGVLLKNSDILNAAVIGAQESAETSEFPRAYIVVRQGASLTAQQVQGYTSQHLAKYKRLTGGVRFLTELPKNANYEVLKNVLRDYAERVLAEAKRLYGQQSSL